MNTYPDAPAAPAIYEEEVGDYGRKCSVVNTGLTKREYFAAKFVTKMIKLYGNTPLAFDSAVEAADDLIFALNKVVNK